MSEYHPNANRCIRRSVPRRLRKIPNRRRKSGKGLPPFLNSFSRCARQVHLCEDIAARSGTIREKLKAVREDGQKGKEDGNRTRSREAK